MTKQEELTGLRELKGHYRSIECLERKIDTRRTDLEHEQNAEIYSRAPRYPETPEIVSKGLQRNPGASEFSEQTPPKYYSIIMGILHAIFVTIACTCIGKFYASAPLSEAEQSDEYLAYIVIFIVFHSAAIASLIYFDQKHKAAGFIGYIVLSAIALGPTVFPMAELAEQIPDYIIFTAVGLPATTAVLALILKIVELVQFRAKQKNDVCKYNAAYNRHEKDLAEYNATLKRVTAQVKKEYQPKVAAMEQLCSTLRKEINAHKAAIGTAKILHKEHHGDIDYIIRLMETGVADSIKEALQIKRAEDQKSQANSAMFGAMLEMENLRRKQEEDRRWEEQRAQWARNQAQAERERERIKQAKRAADELESIRKKLEND